MISVECIYVLYYIYVTYVGTSLHLWNEVMRVVCLMCSLIMFTIIIENVFIYLHHKDWSIIFTFYGIFIWFV